jgi:D-alanyl-D-alanine carboxypeptidase/D-alanyl-D-alanine-endopeptidase (penicillin-binding protein 4)
VKRIEGSIVADDSYFSGNPVPSSWEWDDLQWYYGAEVSALPLNDNAVDLAVGPGPVGYPCSVKLSPYNPVFRVKNLCLTTAAGTPRTLKIDKQLGQNQLEISGTLPAGNAGFSGSVTVSRPAELFAALLKQRLEMKGIAVTGQYSVRSPAAAIPAAEQVELAKLESPPLRPDRRKDDEAEPETCTPKHCCGRWGRSKAKAPTSVSSSRRRRDRIAPPRHR